VEKKKEERERRRKGEAGFNGFENTSISQSNFQRGKGKRKKREEEGEKKEE